MQRAGDLYQRALRVFSARTGRLSSEAPWKTNDRSEPSSVGSPEMEWPMEAIPQRFRSTLRRWETLLWAEHLARHQSQPIQALRLIAGEIRREPLEAESWRALARNLLPQPIVRLVIRVRHA
jgi:hypothetical protein